MPNIVTFPWYPSAVSNDEARTNEPILADVPQRISAGTAALYGHLQGQPEIFTDADGNQ